MPIQQLIYTSRPFGYDLSVLASILVTSRQRNARDDITGALICRADVFLQLLEGPPGRVAATYERICADDRHVEVTPLVSERVSDRLFPQWAMKHDPAISWLFSPDDVSAGALKDATTRDVRAIFLRSAEADPS